MSARSDLWGVFSNECPYHEHIDKAEKSCGCLHGSEGCRDPARSPALLRVFI
jgi:hypothetical protein